MPVSDTQQAVELFFDSLHPTPRAETLKDLGDIAQTFSQLPYENISKVLKTATPGEASTWRRQPLEVMQDHLAHGLGGTCFALTYCMQTVMDSLGVATAPVLADMPSGANHHCALVLRQGDGLYLIDPGYLICEPMRLPDDQTVLDTPRGRLWLRRDRQNGTLDLRYEGEERPRYTLKPEPVDEARFATSWIDSFSWPGMNQLLITRFSEGAQLYLHNRHFRRIRPNEVEKYNLNDNLESDAARLFAIDSEKIRQARHLLNQRRIKKKI